MMFDIAIIGGGPAGLSSGVTGAIRKKKIALFEQGEFSAKLQKAHTVDNYVGLPEISGKDLMQKMADHALSYEEVSLIKEKVTNIFIDNDNFMILTNKGNYQAKSVIMAIGVAPAKLLPGEKEFLGRGVSYCATCDGMLYKGKEVVVIGYTAEAEHEAEYLAEICEKVTYLPQYKMSDEKKYSFIVKKDIIKEIVGTMKVEQLVLGQETIAADGIFIIRATDPIDNIFPELALENQVVKVDRDMATNIKGVFAAGDCIGKPWQISKASGEGLVAIHSVINYLNSVK